MKDKSPDVYKVQIILTLDEGEIERDFFYDHIHPVIQAWGLTSISDWKRLTDITGKILVAHGRSPEDYHDELERKIADTLYETARKEFHECDINLKTRWLKIKDEWWEDEIESEF